jgi:alpha-tubulin suppressor-like RCC1 family protein
VTPGALEVLSGSTLEICCAIGDGTGDSRSVPTAVAGGRFFKQLTAGQHTCGKTSDSVGYCWGWNGSGQLGDGTTIAKSTPTAVAAPS